MAATRAQLGDDIRALGIGPGDTALVHSSLKSLGRVEGGADAVIDAFLDVLGPEGTLCAPTVIRTSGSPRPLYDPASSQKLSACVPARRSAHPAESLAAIGKHAAYLTSSGARDRYSPWGEDAYDTDSPWEKLGKVDAKVLLLGVGYNVVTLRHLVEAMFYEKLCARHPHVKYPPYTRIGSGFFTEFEARGMVKTGTVANAEVRILNAKEIIEHGLELMDKDSLKYLRGDARAFVKNHMDGNRIFVGASKVDLVTGSRATLARVVVMQNDATTLVLVVCEVIGVVKGVADAAREMIRKRFDIPGDHISICATHRHNGVSVFPPSENNAGLRQALPGRIVEGVAAALDKLKPQTAYVNEVRLDAFIRNEEIRTTDGRIHSIRRAVPSTWKWKEKDEVVGIDGPVDDALGIVDFRDDNGNSTAVIVNLSVHDIPDFFEQAMARVERELGLEIKQHVGKPYSWILGIDNDICCYVAPPERYDQRGYHVDPTQACLVGKESAAIIKKALFRIHESMMQEGSTDPHCGPSYNDASERR